MRYLRSLFTPPDPLPLAGGAEVHMVEYHHVDDDLDWRTATMVVNFVDTLAVRRVFGTLQGMFVAARSTATVFSGTGGIGRLCSNLRVQQFGTADAVLYTAGNLSVDADILQEAVDAIRAMGPGLVVVVDDDCRRWHDLVGVSGFVRGAAPSRRRQPRPLPSRSRLQRSVRQRRSRASIMKMSVRAWEVPMNQASWWRLSGFGGVRSCDLRA